MKRILILSKGYPPDVGGLETYAEKVAAAYAAKGLDVTVLTSCSEAWSEEQRGRNLRVVNVGQSAHQWRVMLRMLLRLLPLVRESKFDLVHATTWRLAVPAMIMLPSVRRLITVHGREVFVVPRLLKPLMKLALRKAFAVIAVSRPILDELVRRYALRLRRAAVAWNGVSFAEAAGPSDGGQKDPYLAFTVCRLVERKNIVSAVRAVGSLRRQGIEITYAIAGRGPEYDALARVVAEESLEGAVQLLGYVSDREVVHWYRRAGIFLHPQIAPRDGDDLEGFGISIADAMSFGCIPIVGASGGPSDFVTHGVNGLVVQSGTPDEVVSCLRSLAGDPSLYRQLSESAVQFARTHLTWDTHVRKALQLAMPPADDDGLQKQ